MRYRNVILMQTLFPLLLVILINIYYCKPNNIWLQSILYIIVYLLKKGGEQEQTYNFCHVNFIYHLCFSLFIPGDVSHHLKSFSQLRTAFLSANPFMLLMTNILRASVSHMLNILYSITLAFYTIGCLQNSELFIIFLLRFNFFCLSMCAQEVEEKQENITDSQLAWGKLIPSKKKSTEEMTRLNSFGSIVPRLRTHDFQAARLLLAS